MCLAYRINKWYRKPANVRRVLVKAPMNTVTVILAFLLALPVHLQGQYTHETNQDTNLAESSSNAPIWSAFLKSGPAWAVNNTACRFPPVDLYQDNYRPHVGNPSDPLAPRHVMAINGGLRVGFGVNYEATTLMGLILAAVTGTGAAIVHSRAEHEIGIPPAFPVPSSP